MGNIDPVVEKENVSGLVSGNKLVVSKLQEKVFKSLSSYGVKNKTEAADTTMAR